jgi:hypothetical protein
LFQLGELLQPDARQQEILQEGVYLDEVEDFTGVAIAILHGTLKIIHKAVKDMATRSDILATLTKAKNYLQARQAVSHLPRDHGAVPPHDRLERRLFDMQENELDVLSALSRDGNSLQKLAREYSAHTQARVAVSLESTVTGLPLDVKPEEILGGIKKLKNEIGKMNSLDVPAGPGTKREGLGADPA